MAGNKNRGSGGLVYHWRHGWIPRTPTAALQKAKGSHEGAEKLMGKHGIEGDLPSGKGKADAPKAVSKDHNLAALEVRKGHNDKGFVVTHKPSGLHLGHTFSTKGAAEAARQEHASTPHDLNVPADKLHADATKHLGDMTAKHRQTEQQRGQQASQVVAAKRNRPAGPKVSNPAKPGDLVVVSSEHSDWSGKGRTVTEQHTPGVVTHVHSDGTPIAYKDAQGRFATVGPRDKTRVMSQDEIDVQGLLGQVKSTNKWSGGQDKAHFDNLDAIQSSAKSFRKSKTDAPGVDAPAAKPHRDPHTLKPGERATVRGTDEYGQPATYTGIVRANGEVSAFKKGRTTGGEPLRSIAIEREDGSKRQNVVYVPDPDRGESKRGTAAEREVRNREQVARTRAAQPAAARQMDRMAAADKAATPTGSVHATRAAELRAAAAKKRADADRVANGAGVNDRAAAMLSGKTHQRQVARDDSSLRRYAETTRRADALEARARSAEGRVAREQEKQRAVDLNLKPSDVTPGDMVLHNGRLQIVTKVNKTTVNVPSGYSWDDKVSLSKVTRHVPLSTQSDAAIQKAYGATSDAKVKAALRAELLRRGLTAA